MVTAVIYPSEREGWNAQVVTKSLDTMESDFTFDPSIDTIIDKIIIRSISDSILIICNIKSKEIEFYTSKYYNYDK